MKNNFLFPVITATILAAVGIILEFFGFDFLALLNNSTEFKYYKELLFVTIAAILIVGIILYELISSYYKKKLQNNEDVLCENKKMRKELTQLHNDLDSSKKAYAELMKLNDGLKINRALNNYKIDN